MCVGHEYCASVDETRSWLMDKFIVLLYNRSRFITDGFEEEKDVHESVLKYIPISS